MLTGLMARPEVNEEDKKALEGIKMILNCRDKSDVERDLAFGVVRESTVDKIKGLNKYLADTCLEHIQRDPLVRVFRKQLSHIKIERDKKSEKVHLFALWILVLEG